MSPSDERPAGPALPAGVAVAFGSAADIDLLRPFWLALHRIHQEVNPELAPHVGDADVHAAPAQEQRHHAVAA